MALEKYRKKRKFGITPEPRGRKGRRAGNRYVIQKHAARRLHYDLRLELDGVMKSWAIARGPSLDPGQKRLAVHVEDHPIEYNAFEGTIPEGEYGGGTVMIWDRGHWIPEGDPHKGYAKGHLDFVLEGQKLRGRWHLVRMRPRERDLHENWLLIKGNDEEARSGRDEDILEEQPLSAATGRSMEEIAAGKGKKRIWHSGRRAREAPANSAPQSQRAFREELRLRSKAKVNSKNKQRHFRGRPPAFVPPSLATLHGSPPSGAEWIHEVKFDGYRIEARLDHGEVQLLTRKQLDWTRRFDRIAKAVAALPAQTALLDGELVVENEKGVSSFSMLQTDLKEGRDDRFVYWVFDLLYLDGRDFRDEPLMARKAALRRLLKGERRNGSIRYADHFEEDGAVVFKHASELGLEGIVSKRRDASYRSGRSDNFVKTKSHDAQEFIVAGFVPSTVTPKAIGALTVAFHEKGRLRYAGRVGTGYTRQTSRDLWERLNPLRTERASIALPKDERRKGVVWVKPEVVIEAEFRGITHDGLLRQAAFKGVREDKPAREVVRETPARADPVPMPRRQPVRKSPPAHNDVAGIRLTHPDRIYWADVGITKEDLAAYYVKVWSLMAPNIVARPLAIVRCPDGTAGECFFQKHIASNIKQSSLRHTVDSKEHDVIAVERLSDLIELVQSGALEIHVRGSRLGRLEACDRIVFDLDPGEDVDWKEIVAAAQETRDRLKAEKLKSFVKLSGGKGIHVVVPIAAADWETVKTFTARIARAMNADSPRRYIAKMTKSLRRGKIFIDYFRNSREATSVAVYSTRARAGAPVSMPLDWDALPRTTGGNQVTVLNLKRFLKSDAWANPWAEIGKVRQKLPAK